MPESNNHESKEFALVPSNKTTPGTLTTLRRSLRIPRKALIEVINSVLPGVSPQDYAVVITIVIPDRKVNIRQFASYLNLVDRFYGRLTPDGLHSYSHREAIQLEISEIGSGSLLLRISKLLAEVDPTTMVILFLLLKYLPNVIKAAAELGRVPGQIARDLSESYRNYEEAQLVRINREQLKEHMRNDAALDKVDGKTINALVRLMDELYAAEANRLSGAIRFVRRHAVEVRLTLRKKKAD